ncbi:hypothetical protein [Chlorobium sp. N1]|uniref:hypothetical protein n=1 Tax=Chlorobium sp. N1 TaxID=2491138 RepID=UPI0010405458|nr:hypothetical protein [Chlorobium sp. N1]TCD47833.1 hypothetical protein E0L29_06015 [Chlorobium sp. N1]
MPNRNPNIFRSAWRLFEVLLFFIVSVLGFGLLFKTSGFGSRSKEKLRQQHTAAAAVHESRLTALAAAFAPFERGRTLLPEVRAGQDETAPAALSATAFDRPAILAPPAPAPLASAPPYSALLALPANLLQENPVLLI